MELLPTPRLPMSRTLRCLGGTARPAGVVAIVLVARGAGLSVHHCTHRSTHSSSPVSEPVLSDKDSNLTGLSKGPFLCSASSICSPSCCWCRSKSYQIRRFMPSILSPSDLEGDRTPPVLLTLGRKAAKLTEHGSFGQYRYANLYRSISAWRDGRCSSR